MQLGLETFSYHLAFAYGKMDIFDFIKRTAEFELDGVEINMEGADLAHLGSDDPGFLRDVRALTDELALYVELDTCDTNPQNLTRALDICRALGARQVAGLLECRRRCEGRTRAGRAEDFRQVIPLCADYGVRIAYENHEYETSHDVLQVVREVDSEYVGTHVDTGNSMFIWEEPIEAIRNMAPYAISTHFKDHTGHHGRRAAGGGRRPPRQRQHRLCGGVQDPCRTIPARAHQYRGLLRLRRTFSASRRRRPRCKTGPGKLSRPTTSP